MLDQRFIKGVWAVVLLAALLFATPERAAAQDYLLQSGDVIEVTVLEDPNLNRRVLVGPDGNISLPLAGKIAAGGRTLAQVQATIRSRLSNQFVNPPSVTASLVALGPKDPEAPADAEDEPEIHSVYVIGEVARPGRYSFEAEEPITILQALSLAGGPGVFAARSRIQIRDSDPGNEKIILFRFQDPCIVDNLPSLYMTMLETADRKRITARSMLELLSAAYTLNPAFGEAEVLEIGVDARPAFPDNLPRIRRVGSTIYANGLFRHGFLLGPALARQVADLIETNQPPEFMDEDHPERGAA